MRGPVIWEKKGRGYAWCRTISKSFFFFKKEERKNNKKYAFFVRDALVEKYFSCWNSSKPQLKAPNLPE